MKLSFRVAQVFPRVQKRIITCVVSLQILSALYFPVFLMFENKAKMEILSNVFPALYVFFYAFSWICAFLPLICLCRPRNGLFSFKKYDLYINVLEKLMNPQGSKTIHSWLPSFGHTYCKWPTTLHRNFSESWPPAHNRKLKPLFRDA
jgi:hypothetical protein